MARKRTVPGSRDHPKKAEQKPDQELSVPEARPFDIVGIGASAGGLEAFREFFEHLPAESGMAFVIVSHLDPTHKGYLPELIGRFTPMTVMEITDGLQVRQNTVYVIPPNAELSILHGNFSLLEPAPHVHGLRMTIDHFFRELAGDQKEHSIGIILSGTGTDGTLGIRAIKENGGIVIVQDPVTAKFGGMPKSAMDTGLADIIAPPSGIPGKLLEFTHYHARTLSEERTQMESPGLQKIFILLRAKTGHDFSLYKKSTISRRVERRMNVHQLGRLDDYVRFLQENPQEIDILFHEILIGVTSFFREPESWNSFKENALPRMLRSREDGGTIRAWVIGCATGEEAYSLAMVLREVLDVKDRERDIRIQIFASDIYPEALDIARLGVYPAAIAADVSAERLERFFTKEDDRYRIKKEIRDCIVFAEQDVIRDPPFTRLDIVTCRNLFIYFMPELQKKILPILCYSLLPGGILFFGSAETIGEASPCFKSLDTKWKIFERGQLARGEWTDVVFPSSPVPVPATREPAGRMQKNMTIPDLAQHILLEHHTPAAVLMTGEGDILYFHGRTGKYLEHVPGKANLNIYAMAPERLRFEIGNAVRKALKEEAEVTVKNLEVGLHDTTTTFDLIVRPIRKPDELRGYLMVIFAETRGEQKKERPGKGRKGSTGPESACPEMEENLRLARAALQTAQEERAATLEEQQSINEELQSTNEELQSTNEELTTSKEELQSLNEELSTVNSELEMKIDELSRSRDDMENMLKGTDIAMLFLDMQLNVRRFTKPVTQIINLLPNDIGRPITDLVTTIRYDSIEKEVKEVLATLERKEFQVETRDGAWFIMRILPYRTSENRIDGVIITFSEITTIKTLEQSLIDARDYAENVINTIREPLLILDTGLRIISASRSFYETFQLKPESTVGRTIYSVGGNQWDIPELRHLLEEIIPKNSRFEDYRLTTTFSGIGDMDLILNARKIRSDKPGVEYILLAMEQETREGSCLRKQPVRDGHTNERGGIR